jgi:hypothetical protein
MARWPTPDNPYAARKRPQVRWPKASIAVPGLESGGRVSGGKSTRHPEGLGTVKSGYLTGKAGGEAHEFYHRTERRKRTPADYGSRTPKPEK